MQPSVSLVIPVLNEAADIVGQLKKLQSLRSADTELIVVDGGSADNTVALAEPLADKIVVSNKGRSLQMNAGARQASGEIVYFLHIDTCLPVDFLCWAKLAQQADWGFFQIRLSGSNGLFRLIERMMSWRSQLTGIGTGDQVIFCRRAVFQQQGGFPEIPLMEDISFSRALKKISRPYVVPAVVVTSSRRWEQNGILRTVLLMWRLRLAYFLGVSPGKLVRDYYQS